MQWQDVIADKTLQDLPYKIELNEWGNIEMSPASFIHSYLQGEIATRLRTQLGGRIFTELAVETKKGIKVHDVAWGSDEYFKKHLNDIGASATPEIYIEIISASNSQKEMDNKIALFLPSGAVEVWLVDELANITFYNAEGLQAKSSFNVEIGLLL